ncbi:MAG TPA: RluA family pseudouridine synthase [Humisphaera sp.]|jgi:23S rRNA pseudouridine1911/1915/1917 synthase|nr:RluA family pseudouridine synthase [Humisphaera sp.]
MFTVPPEMHGQTLAAVVRLMAPPRSWSEARRLIQTRRVRVNGTLTLDSARRLNAGELVEVRVESALPVPKTRDVVVRYSDSDLIVVEKPPVVQSERRPEERNWNAQRKAAQPTLDELVARLVPRSVEVRSVHRLDRDTSGLMLFALSAIASERLARMFAKHEVRRVYTAVVHGHLETARTIETLIVRERGDGVRGSVVTGAKPASGKRAVTDVRPIEYLPSGYTIVDCRLETGRTHQIRIHLSEIGHRLCGEKMYTHAIGQPPQKDDSGAPRIALHSSSLSLIHPITQKQLEFESPLPRDLSNWLQKLRK